MRAALPDRYRLERELGRGGMATVYLARDQPYDRPVALSALGRRDAALAAYADALQVIEWHPELYPDDLYPDDARAIYFSAGSLVSLGQRERGLAWARRAVEIDPGDAGILYTVAGVHALAGDLETAVDFLERAAALGILHKGWIIHDADFVSVRDHPRFQTLISRL